MKIISAIIKALQTQTNSTMYRGVGFKRAKQCLLILCVVFRKIMGERENSMHSFVRCMKESDSLKRLEKVTASRFQTVGDR